MLMLLVAVAVAGALWWVLQARAQAPAPAPPRRVLDSAVLDSALAPQREALEATRRAVLRVALEAFPADEPTASKVGGQAWWPDGTPAPVGEDGRALVLLAQINFAELPPTPGYPDSGLLQFLISPNDYYGANFEHGHGVEQFMQQRNFRVAYWPDLTLPSTPLPVAARDDDMLPHDPGQPRRMRFQADTETLSSGDYRFHALMGGDAFVALEAWAEAKGLPQDAVNQVYERHAGTGHKIGGYPDFAQEDPREGGPLELLLQLDSDDHMMWGDSGIAGFFIDPADLARRDFSRVMYTWDCY